MRRMVPKKNISGSVADITASEGKSRESGESSVSADSPDFWGGSGRKTVSNNAGKMAFTGKKSILKKALLGLFLSFLVILVLWGAGIYSKWDRVLGYFNSASGEMSSLLGRSGSVSDTAGSAADKFTIFDLVKNKDLWQNAGAAYASFQNFSAAGIGLIQEADALEKNWPSLLFGGEGQELVSHLQKIRDYIGLMSESNNNLSSLNIGFGNFLMREYGSPLSLQLSFKRMDDFLGALISWLSLDGERHILVLFGNSSELRPGGGFIGSYADVVFDGGSVKSFDVHDVNDADREFAVNIVPPKQLQTIDKGWTIADSNWFFDYALSAAKTIQFMEWSKMYSGGISFDGAIAISPKVVGDILAVTGPIELKSSGVTIDKDNFLKEIQSDVQDSQSKGKLSKKIIAELAPEILSRIGSFKQDENMAVMNKLGDWISKKDVMIYFKDQDIENFLDFYGASGKSFEPSNDFNGDYLAVPSANIGSGKSDIFINQKVLFRSQLNFDGTTSDHLEITRENSAGANDSWWYRLPNESYVQVFTPQGTSLSGFRGGVNKKIVPKVDYGGYRIDPLVASIESTMTKNFNYQLVDEFREYDKKVFGVWTKTGPGQTSNLVFDYSTHLFSPPTAGQKYQFVFEKQSGSSGDYKFEIYAPVGLIWKESNSPVYEYETSDPAGRIVITLTVENQNN